MSWHNVDKLKEIAETEGETVFIPVNQDKLRAADQELQEVLDYLHWRDYGLIKGG